MCLLVQGVAYLVLVDGRGARVHVVDERRVHRHHDQLSQGGGRGRAEKH